MDGFPDSSNRMPTHLWVEAEVRRLLSEGYGVYVNARGDRAGGLVIQKIADMAGSARVLVQQRDAGGRLVWMNALEDDVVAERDADSYIARAVDRDPDLWVVEIEDRQMRFPLLTAPA
ncbi:MAG: DUF1491 family protein [Micavibrio sp.]